MRYQEGMLRALVVAIVIAFTAPSVGAARAAKPKPTATAKKKAVTKKQAPRKATKKPTKKRSTKKPAKRPATQDEKRPLPP